MQTTIITIFALLFCAWIIRSQMRLRAFENYHMDWWRLENKRTVGRTIYEIAEMQKQYLDSLGYSAKTAAQAGETLRNIVVSSRKFNDNPTELKAQTLPLLYLAQEWKARQIQYEQRANDPEISNYNRAKFTYKATATRDCYKELLAVLKG